MKTADLVGVDTNVLVFADDSSSAHHEKAKRILEDALTGSSRMCLSHQVLAEYFSVVTSAARAKEPLSAQEAKERVLFLNKARAIKKIHPKRSTLKRCIEFCAQHDIKGVRVFDVLYAITLLDNGVRKLLTQNLRDFGSLKEKGFEAINPF